MIDVNGTSLYYEDSGPGSTGETIVFSHGLLWGTEMFEAQIEALRGRYRCVAWDHRGQGRSASDHRHIYDAKGTLLSDYIFRTALRSAAIIDEVRREVAKSWRVSGPT